MDGYYDPFPPLIPERSIGLIGFIGADQARIGSILGSVTGLPFSDIPRLVEHEQGEALASLIEERGEQAVRTLEGTWVKKLLSAQPPGILSFGHAGLHDRALYREMNAAMTLVYIAHDPGQLRESVFERIERVPRLFAPWLTVSSVFTGDFERLWQEHGPSYEQLEHRVDATGRSPEDCAYTIARDLGLIR